MTEIAKEYAAALFELAEETGGEKEVLQALETIQAAFEENPEYAILLDSPNIPLRERKECIQNAFGKAMPATVLSFTEILCEKGHIDRFCDCAEEYKLLYLEKSGVAAAKIISAVPLTEQEKQTLIQRLQTGQKQTVTAEYEIDESILGGVIVQMDGRIIDGSLRRRLKEIKEGLGK